MTSPPALALAALLLLAAAGRAQAGDTQVELVPEVNADLRLSETATDVEVGAHLDVTLMPILRRRLRDADWERGGGA